MLFFVFPGVVVNLSSLDAVINCIVDRLVYDFMLYTSN